MKLSNRPLYLALFFLAIAVACALTGAGCGATRTVIEKDGFRLEVSDTQLLRERSIGAASYTRDDKGVSLQVNDAKSASTGAAELLRGVADAIEKAK